EEETAAGEEAEAPCVAPDCAQRGAATAHRKPQARRVNPKGNQCALLRQPFARRRPRNTSVDFRMNRHMNRRIKESQSIAKTRLVCQPKRLRAAISESDQFGVEVRAYLALFLIGWGRRRD